MICVDAGKIKLDSVFQERMNLNISIVGELHMAFAPVKSALFSPSFHLHPPSPTLTHPPPPSPHSFHPYPPPPPPSPTAHPYHPPSILTLPPEAINHAAEAWGLLCLRYEIKDIQLPTRVKEAMQMQVEAERKKRANILESEGKPPPYPLLTPCFHISLLLTPSSHP